MSLFPTCATVESVPSALSALTALTAPDANDHSSLTQPRFVPPNVTSRSIVLIDRHVEAVEQLVAGLIDDAAVYFLDHQRDGVTQIREILQNIWESMAAAEAMPTPQAPLTVHIFAHGAPGTLFLGNTELSLATLPLYTAELQTWFSPALGDSAQALVLYGCEVAVGDAGHEFLSRLHQITGASVAASRYPVGHSSRGGRWELGWQIGAVAAPLALTERAIAHYPGLLAASVTSITRRTPTSANTNADILIFQVTFSEGVQNVDVADFGLNGTGIAGATISNVVPVSGSTTTYDVTITGVATNNGTINLDLAPGQTITDLATNSPLASITPATDETFTLDNTTPTLLSFSRQTPGGESTNADILVFRAVFSEAVQNIDPSDFAVSGSTASIISVVAVAGAPNEYDITLAGGNLTNLNGSVGINLAAGQNIRDSVGNALPVTEPAIDQTYLLDNTAATVVAVTSPAADGRYNAGDVLSITVQFSEAVTVTGTPQLTLETGTVDRQATYDSGSGTNTLTFTYTVQAGDTTADLGYISTAALGLNGGAIADAAGNNAGLSLPALGSAGSLQSSKNIIIDTTAPGVIRFSRETPSTSPTNADSLTFRVVFNEAVQGVDVADFSVNGSTAGVTGVVAVAGSQTTYDVTVGGGNLAGLDGIVGLNFSPGQTITDLAGNTLPGAEPSIDETYLLDNTAAFVTQVSSPTPNGSYNLGDLVTITMQFSEAVQVTGTPALTLETGASDRTATYVSGSGSNTLTFQYTVQAEDASGDLDYVSTAALTGGTIQDVAGNNANRTLATPGTPGSLGDNANLIIDTAAPLLTSIVRQSPPLDTTNADSLVFRVTFSETVQNVNISDFVANGSTAAVASVTPISGSVYDVTLAGGNLASFNGTVGLNLSAAQNIVDGAGNALPGTEPGTDETYTLDNTAAFVTGVSSTAAGRYNAGDIIDITVTFSEAVTVAGATPPQLTLETGTVDQVAAYTSGSGTNTLTFQYTVQPGDVSADLDYRGNVALTFNGSTIRDLAGNNAILTLPNPGGSGSLGSNANIIIDTSAPSLTAITRQTPGTVATNADTLTFQVAFSEAVQNVDASDFVVNGSTATISGVAAVGASQSLYTVTLSGGNLAAFNGSVGLNLAVATNITDLAGNALPVVEPPIDQTYALDNVAATVTGVSATTANGAYNQGDSITLTVQFSEGVLVTGAPQLTLETGDVDAIATYSSGSGTNTLTFTYTVGSGDNTTDLDYASTAALTLSGGSVRDAAGNTATLTLPNPGGTGSLGDNRNIAIDTVIPGLTAITRQTPSAEVTNVDTLVYRVSFSEAVQGVNAADFVVTGSTATISSVTPVGGSASLYDVTLSGGNLATLNGVVGLNVAPGSNITDLAGNSLPVVEPLTDETYTVDNLRATAISVTATTPDGRYNPGDVIEITVQFSEVVTVAGTPQLTLETGTTDVVVDYSTGSGTDTLTFVYTVAAGQTSADLDYRGTTALSLNGGAIQDAAGNAAVLALPTPGTAASLGGSKALVIDTTDPTLLSFVRQNPAIALTNADSLTFRVTFNEAVENVTPTDFEVLGSTATVSEVVAVGTNQTVYDVTVTGGNLATVNGTVGLNLTATRDITDLAGNSLPLAEPAIDQSYTLDNIPAAVTGVTATAADGRYNQGDPIAITIAFSEAVTVTGVPQLTLETGDVDAIATYTSGSGTNTLTFRYTVGTGQNSPDLDYADTMALALNGGSIRDAAGNDATLTLPNVGGANSLGGTKALVIDTIAPQFVSIQRQDPIATPTNADSLVFRVTFSEAVQGVNPADFTVGGSTATVTSIVAVDDSQLTYDVTVSGGNLDSRSGNVGLNLATAASITDLAGNVLPSGEPPINERYTLDNALPSVVRVSSSSPDGGYRAGDTLDITVEFSEGVLVLGSPQITLETGSDDAVVDYFAGSGTNTLTFRYEVRPGDNTADLGYRLTTSLGLNGGSIQDAAGNAAVLTLAPPNGVNSLRNNKALVIDSTTPTLVAIARQTPSLGLTNANSLVFRVSFSEAVLDVDAADFTVNGSTTGTVTGVTAVTGSMGTVYDVTVAGGDLEGFNGTVGLNLATDQSIRDQVNNALLAGEPATDEVYTLENITPTVTSILRKEPIGATTGLNSLVFTVTFSETVTGINRTDFILATTGTAAGTVTSVSANSGDTVDVTVSSVTGLGTLRLDVLNTATVIDAAGNDLDTDFTGGESYNVDVSPPAVDLLAVAPRVQDGRVNAATGTIGIAFSEAVTGFDVADLRLTRNGVLLSLTGATLESTDSTNFTLGGLASLTRASGNYSLRVVAPGSEIVDTLGTAIASGDVVAWKRGTVALVPPAGDFSGGLRGLRRLGNNGPNSLNGAANNDTLFGRGGADLLNGLGGNDVLNGEAGGDRLRGGGGNDRLDGGAGNDTLFGEAGNDLLIGSGGNDRLVGGAGRDTFVGGAGRDTLVSGGNGDVFRLNSIAEAGDVIQQFNVARDVIDLSPIFSQAAFSTGTPFARFDQYVRFARSGASTTIQIDRDGAGVNRNFVTLFTLQGITPAQLSGNNVVIG